MDWWRLAAVFWGNRRLVLGAAGGLVLAGIIGSPSALAAGATLEGPNVVHYGQPYELGGAERFVIEGERLPDGGCEFTRSSIIGDTDVAEIEVAHDPDTCRSVVERGTWADTNPSLSAGEGTASRSDSSSSSAPTKGTDDSAPASGDATTAAVSQKLAYSWSWYDEPARWIRGNDVEDSGWLPPVNTLRNRVEWYPDGNCAVAPGYTGWMYWDATWLTETGWSFAYHNWVTSPDPIDCSPLPRFGHRHGPGTGIQ